MRPSEKKGREKNLRQTLSQRPNAKLKLTYRCRTQFDREKNSNNFSVCVCVPICCAAFHVLQRLFACTRETIKMKKPQNHLDKLNTNKIDQNARARAGRQLSARRVDRTMNMNRASERANEMIFNERRARETERVKVFLSARARKISGLTQVCALLGHSLAHKSLLAAFAQKFQTFLSMQNLRRHLTFSAQANIKIKQLSRSREENCQS